MWYSSSNKKHTVLLFVMGNIVPGIVVTSTVLRTIHKAPDSLTGVETITGDAETTNAKKNKYFFVIKNQQLANR